MNELDKITDFHCQSRQGGCGAVHECNQPIGHMRYIAPCKTYWSRLETGSWEAFRLVNRELVPALSVAEDRPSPTPITPVVFCTLCGEPSKHAEFHQRQICSRCYEKEM